MSERNKTILVDMDGVMADFDKAALARIPERERVPRTSFYVVDGYGPKQSEIIKSTYNDPVFFENLEPMPGLMGGWQALIDAGYNPRVASSPLSSNPSAIEGKIKWLDRIMVPEFGSSVVEKAIIDKDKWKYSGRALLDDRPSVMRGPDGTDVADWQHVLFGPPRVKKVPMATAAFWLMGWEDVDELIVMLESS